MLREQMTTGSTAGAPGFSNAADPKGPVAGYDKPLRKKKRYIYVRGVRKNWKNNG
jgi:hypothetical protein|tara:strand:+ start:1619 stop:1783 length:165 start_codon:yes stop_codon:yes gene_type:complete